MINAFCVYAGDEAMEMFRICSELGIFFRDWFPDLDNEPTDLVFLVNYPHRISPADIARVPLGIINFHPAPLPQYRGRNGVAHAILNGEKMWAVAAHYIDGGYDTGPVITSDGFPIEEDDTAYTLWQSSQEMMRMLFRAVASTAMQADGKLPATPQDESLAHYYNKDSLASLHDCTGLAGDDLHRRVRALTFPGKPKPYITVGGHRYELTLKESE